MHYTAPELEVHVIILHEVIYRNILVSLQARKEPWVARWEYIHVCVIFLYMLGKLYNTTWLGLHWTCKPVSFSYVIVSSAVKQLNATSEIRFLPSITCAY